MATQYTAGITQGQVWTAAIANQIGAVWETWTPTFTPTSGTITTASLTRARYAQIQKIVFARLDYVVTTAGTAAGAFLDFTLPITAASYSTGGILGIGRESGVTGNTLNCILINTTTARLTTYVNGGVVQSGYGYSLILTYEAA
jgi:hypothetical protein